MLRSLEVLQSACKGVRSLSSASVGLFHKPELQQPSDWVKYAQDTVHRCQPIVEEAVAAPASAFTIQLMDDISDHLCQVYDSAEFCRNVHASHEWRQQALQAVMITARYVQELNMHHGLYSAVVRSMQHCERLQSHGQASASGNLQASGCQTAEAAGYDEETIMVGRALQKDFEQRGVHLDAEGQSRASKLTEDIARLGMAISGNISDVNQVGTVTIPWQAEADWLGEVPEAWRDHMASKLAHRTTARQHKFNRSMMNPVSGSDGPETIPLDQASVTGVLQWVSNEDVRKQVWQASRHTPERNKDAVVEFCLLRKEFAHLVGFESHSHLQAGLASLAGDPQAVVSFFDQAHQSSREKAAREYGLLRVMKQVLTGDSNSTPQHWDRPLLTRQIKEDCGLSSSALGQYLTLSNCLKGLCTIVHQLTGVRLLQEPLQQGESWAPGVQKMVAFDEPGNILGHIYLDLFPRQGKFAHAAHFVLRCGRQPSSGSYQTPVVALACNFEQPPNGCISYTSALTLFHEFGHALHSLLSKTKYQHMSGTRGAMDVIEIPSHFMQNFMNDPGTVDKIARHHSTGDAVPAGLVERTLQDSQLFGALDMETQICHSMMDQLFHGVNPPESRAAAADALCEIWSKYSSFPTDDNLNPHLRFAHLVDYGGAYYSYAYAMCLASSIWRTQFQAEPLSRTAGNRLRYDLLQPGGSRDPVALITNLLGADSLRHIGGGYAPQADGLLHHYGLKAVT